MAYKHNYTVKDGIITNPGKFEREAHWAPYFYEHAGEAEYTASEPFEALTRIMPDDREAYPDLPADGYAVYLCESDQGFVTCHVYSRAEYDEAVAQFNAEIHGDDDQFAETSQGE